MTEQELRLVAELTTAFHFCAEGPGAAAWLSPSFFALTGAASPPADAWRWTDAIDSADRAPFLDRWHQAVVDRARLQADVRLTMHDGRRQWYHVHAAQIDAPAGTGAERRWVGAGVAGKFAELGSGDRDRLLQAEFLATASHELRTPLNAVAGWLYVLKLRARGDLEQLHALSVIERNVAAEKMLIDELLDLSRLERGLTSLAPSQVDLCRLVRETVAVVGVAAAARGVPITIDVPDPPVLIAADMVKMQQVVWHLLTNAVKFTRAPGSVRASVTRASGEVRLRVGDTGAGMDAASLAHVFDPFGQIRQAGSRSGLGLGLSVVQWLVQLHGGTVTAASDGLGRGSVFEVTLPQPMTSPRPN